MFSLVISVFGLFSLLLYFYCSSVCAPFVGVLVMIIIIKIIIIDGAVQFGQFEVNVSVTPINIVAWTISTE